MTTTRTERPTAHIAVIDQHGHRHVVTERTTFMHFVYLDGKTQPPTPVTRRYDTSGMFVNVLDNGSMETADGQLQLTRV